MRGGILIWLGMLVPCLVWAADVLPTLNANDQIYTNVTITRVTATDIYFTSDSGIGNAKLKELDRKLQKHFHYDATKARAAERLQTQDAALYHQKMLHDFPQPTFPPPSSAATNATLGVATESKPIWANSFLNKAAPQFLIEKWLTPAPDVRGKFIIYDFWSAGSPACRAEIQELNAFQQKFKDRLVIIGISDEPENVVRAVADPIIQYSVAIDSQARMKNAVGVTGLPHLMLIDPNGYVRWEGFPFLKDHEFGDQVLTDIIAQYDKSIVQAH